MRARERRGEEEEEEKTQPSSTSPFFRSLSPPEELSRFKKTSPSSLLLPSFSLSPASHNARAATTRLRHQRPGEAALGLARGGLAQGGERKGNGERRRRRRAAAACFAAHCRCCSFCCCAFRGSSRWGLFGARRPARQARRDQAKANWGRSSTSGDERRRRACKCSFFPPRRRPTEPFLRSEAAFRRGLVPGRRSRSSRNQRRRDDCQCR